MRTLLFCFLLLGLSLAAQEREPPYTGVPLELIFGGHRAHQGHFPFYVYQHNCGGSLLTPTHVLTAAHCITDSTLGNTVVMGLDDRENYEGVHGVQIRTIIRAEPHKEYNVDGKDHNDIAIIEVDKPFQLDNYVQLTKIKADDTDLRKTYWATAIGFGMSDIEKKGNESHGVWPRYLQYVYEPVYDTEQCKKTWYDRFWDKQVCAGGANAGVAHGDSGGPLTMSHDAEYFQIGIASYIATGQYRNQDVYPAVFTRTASYCDWMAEKTNGAFHCENNCPN